MKQLVLSFLALVFGLGLVIVSAFHVGQRRLVGMAEAQVVGAEVEEGEVVEAMGILAPETESVSGERESDYYLPYPGILPDHPLYMLKMVRDRVKLWLERDEIKKAERLLVYADKRIGAALVLVEGNKSELGVRTALKAERYLKQAADIITDKDKKELKEKVAAAAAKHKEVLAGMRERLVGDELVMWEEASEFNNMVETEFDRKVADEPEEELPGELNDDQGEGEEEYYPVEIGM